MSTAQVETPAASPLTDAAAALSADDGQRRPDDAVSNSVIDEEPPTHAHSESSDAANRAIIASSLSQVERTADGMRYALVRLHAPSAGLKSIDALAGFPHLLFINISGNDVRDLLPGLSAQSHLLSLVASGNRIGQLNASAVAGRAKVQSIDISDNNLARLRLDGYTELRTLAIGKNGMRELALDNVPALRLLDARGNQLTSISAASKSVLCPLKEAFVAENKFENLEFAASFTALERLHVRSNPVKSLRGLSAAHALLAYLNLRSAAIDDFKELKCLAPLAALRKLYLSDNPICEQDNYRLNVLFRVPQIDFLDKVEITPDDRDEAARLRADFEREEEAASAAAAAASAAAAAAAATAAADADASAASDADARTRGGSGGDGDGNGDGDGAGNTLDDVGEENDGDGGGDNDAAQD